ncbi:MAG: hypothetical protein FWF57_01130 [Defluviitaleaceae bacterium]|nr:hypothetical protein [Defluviitaleaceae bacterium]
MENIQRNSYVFNITLSGLLIAIGTMIPMWMPIRVVIPPASFTLASHAVIFIAMFMSTKIAISVTIGTTIGFFIAGFPIVIVLRAASHLIFAILGAFYLSKINKNTFGGVRLRIFSFIIALIHAVAELIVVVIFQFGNNLPVDSAFLNFAFLMIFLGTIIHSMVDLEIANWIRILLKKIGVLI